MISPGLLEILAALPPGTLPIDPSGPVVTERRMGSSLVRVERFDWDGYADVVVVGDRTPATVVVVVTECGPRCDQTLMPVVRGGEGWVADRPAPDLDPETIEALYRALTGGSYDEPGGVPVMVEAQEDGRLLVVTQAHLGAAEATLGELGWKAAIGWRFAPVTS